MKKLYIIWALALSLLASLLVLNKVNAQSAQGNLELEIQAGVITCDYTSWYDFGTLDATDVMASAQTVSGNLGTFYCEDLEGASDWVLTVQSDELTNGTPAQDMTDIEAMADTNTVIAGSCTEGTNITSYTNIYNSAQSILVKHGSANEVCTIEAENVMVKVEVPQSQPVGQYTSTFTVTYPA